MKSILSFLSILVFISSFATLSCKKQVNWDHEFDTLHVESNQLKNAYAHLNLRVDSLWDVTTEQLKESMPADFPPIEADILLKARNADHMRMFMSFRMLDSATQAIVHRAGETDKLLAYQILEIQKKRNEVEDRKLQFLSKVEEENDKAGQLFRQKFIAVTTE